MKRTILTAAFIGLITAIGNAQVKKEKTTPPPPPPAPVAVTLPVVPAPLPPPVPPGVNAKHQLPLQVDNVASPPAPPTIPPPPKAIKNKQ